jgi:hypothetical protein
MNSEGFHGLTKVLSWNLHGGTQEIHEKAVSIANVTAKIWTERSQM